MKLLSIGLAYGLDLIFGDPGWLPHPVRGIPKLIEFLEKELRGSISSQILSGVVLAAAVVGLAYLGSFFAIRLATQINRWAGFTLSTILRDGRKSPSPHAGIPEAGFADALGIQLGGVNYYQGKRIFKPLGKF